MSDLINVTCNQTVKSKKANIFRHDTLQSAKKTTKLIRK